MVKEYKNGIYPRSLWVATRESLATVLVAFEPEDPSAEWCEEAFAGKYLASIPVCHKNTNKLGYLVVVPEKEDPKEGPMWKHAAHEAVHCAIWCCGDLGVGISGDNQEPLAYLVGYYTECIMQLYGNK